ncbi:MAG: carboxypeptidase-like regulatory domain-containing protein, partial [Flavobacteriales bacterium]
MFPFKTRCARRDPLRCTRWIGVVSAVFALWANANAVNAQSQPHVIEGHVLHASLQSKLPGVLVMAWPCGLATATDASGAFRVACPHGIDSLSVSCVGFATQSILASGDHLDVWLEPLNVDLDQALVATVRTQEMEAAALNRVPLLEALDATPGLQSLDLGVGMIQPVIRGLFGTRVVVLEDGVPQQGGRWGTDHGVLVAPELQVAQSWTPGGG